MARYVMASRRAGMFTRPEKEAARAAIAGVMAAPAMLNAEIIHDNDPSDETARRIVLFDAEPAKIEETIARLPRDVVVEPEILHHTIQRPMDFVAADAEDLLAPFLFGPTESLEIVVTGGGKPLEGAEVLLFLRSTGGLQRRAQAVTDGGGKAAFQYSKLFNPSAAIVLPAGGFWPMILRGPQAPVEVECPRLPRADEHLGWWHRLLGIDAYDKNLGDGIRVGVTDTGTGPHSYLDHVNNVGAFIDGGYVPDGGADVDSHGTHVCGSICARSTGKTRFGGIAPGVEMYTARVFPPDGGANQGDIANAIDVLSREHEVDLINMSLGAAQPSQIEQDAIVDALERGTLCICAAGNENGAVLFPAAFPETIAVAALGLLGFGPAGSMPASRVPTESIRFGDDNLFHANFSCFGDEVVCVAPGVGIIAPVPERFGLNNPYASMDGTSMASPVTCAVLAAILSKSEDYLSLPHNGIRAALARRLLRDNCVSIGLKSVYEGFGLPKVRR